MKRIVLFCLCLSILLCHTVGEVEGNAQVIDEQILQGDALVEIARGKPCFSNWFSPNRLPDYATDGEEDTYFSIEARTVEFYVDLGKPYLIEEIKFLMADTGNDAFCSDFMVSVSEERPYPGSPYQVVVHAQSGKAGYSYVTVSLSSGVKSTPYRFISFEKTSTSGLAIAQVQAYAQPENYDHDTDYWKEIALGKAGFADSSSGGFEPWRALDWDPVTFWTCRGSEPGSRFIVDLGAQYPLRAIAYLPRSGSEVFGKGFDIFASNDHEFILKDLIYSQPSTAAIPNNTISLLEIPDEYYENTYRYLVVDKLKIYGDLAIAHFGVYTTAAYADQYTESKSVLRISPSRPTFSSSPESGTAGGAVVNGYYSTGSYVSKPLDGDTFIYVDLGNCYAVPYVTLASGLWSKSYSYRKDFLIVGTNDPNFQAKNDTILARAEGVIAQDAPANDSGLILYETQKEFKDKKFRYVGVRRKPTPSADGSGRLESLIDLNLLEVYIDDLFYTTPTSSKTTTALRISTNVTGVSAASCAMMLAMYAEDGKFLGCVIQDFPLTQGTALPLVWDIPYNSLPYAAQVKTAKFVLADSFENINIKRVSYDLWRQP